ncbi:hypothetical protein SHI21_08450 [Bacteriovorax sp. PP10]|uniref:Uncharacterized protein n=1 Tax=Bacteriovorax antarcticus TaxID=3088717 RepID=A0ABU5VT55_9BACT|nr:hypothetical protein [Bacteriovorax sp. PP10]MEA9356229.1 hypothetical protein [Bacteriovorax sp. PP10]
MSEDISVGPPTTPAIETTIEEDINASNEYIATKWDQLNRRVDTFFTNQGSQSSKTKSSIFFYSSFYKKEGQSLDTNYDFQVRFDLPNTTKKLKIVIEKQQDEISNAISDTSVSSNRVITKDGKVINANEESHYTAGASLLLKQSKYFASFFNFGIRLDMPLNPFAKIELRKDINAHFLTIGLSQKVIVYRQQGLENISQLVLTKKLNSTFQTDLINSLVWTDESDTLVLRNNFVLTQIIGEEKGLAYSLGANAKFSPTFYYESYDASVSYKQLLYMDWLYATWTLGVDFPKSSHFNDEKFVQFRIDIFFREKG